MRDIVQIVFGAPPMDRLIPASNDSISRHVDRRLDKTFQLLAAARLIGLIFDKNSFDDLRKLARSLGANYFSV